MGELEERRQLRQPHFLALVEDPSITPRPPSASSSGSQAVDSIQAPPNANSGTPPSNVPPGTRPVPRSRGLGGAFGGRGFLPLDLDQLRGKCGTGPDTTPRDRGSSAHCAIGQSPALRSSICAVRFLFSASSLASSPAIDLAPSSTHTARWTMLSNGRYREELALRGSRKPPGPARSRGPPGLLPWRESRCNLRLPCLITAWRSKDWRSTWDNSRPTKLFSSEVPQFCTAFACWLDAAFAGEGNTRGPPASVLWGSRTGNYASRRVQRARPSVSAFRSSRPAQSPVWLTAPDTRPAALLAGWGPCAWKAHLTESCPSVGRDSPAARPVRRSAGCRIPPAGQLTTGAPPLLSQRKPLSNSGSGRSSGLPFYGRGKALGTEWWLAPPARRPIRSPSPAFFPPGPSVLEASRVLGGICHASATR